MRSLAALDINRSPVLEYIDVEGVQVHENEVESLGCRWPQVEICDRYVDAGK